MGTKRKQHSAEFKAQVAMAALSGDRTLAELASEYGVHPTMISTWKQELVKNAKELFERGNKKAADLRWSRSFGQSPGRNKLRPVPGIWF